MRWWCLHTKPPQEKTTARYLLEHQIAYYLAQIVHEGRTPGGRKTRSVPCHSFLATCFLRGDERHRVASLKGNTLVQVLDVPDQEGLESDLRQIHHVLETGLIVVAEPVYPVGTWVRMVDGPLRDMVGVVVRRDKNDRFVALVRFLDQGAAVELRDWRVEPAVAAPPLPPELEIASARRERTSSP